MCGHREKPRSIGTSCPWLSLEAAEQLPCSTRPRTLILHCLGRLWRSLPIECPSPCGPACGRCATDRSPPCRSPTPWRRRAARRRDHSRRNERCSGSGLQRRCCLSCPIAAAPRRFVESGGTGEPRIPDSKAPVVPRRRRVTPSPRTGGLAGLKPWHSDDMRIQRHGIRTQLPGDRRQGSMSGTR
jgi:hypothetical protein